MRAYFLNGHKLKETIYQYIELWNLGNEFKTWFEEACGVYATLVDRIVPGFPRKDIAAIKENCNMMIIWLFRLRFSICGLLKLRRKLQRVPG